MLLLERTLLAVRVVVMRAACAVVVRHQQQRRRLQQCLITNGRGRASGGTPAPSVQLWPRPACSLKSPLPILLNSIALAPPLALRAHSALVPAPPPRTPCAGSATRGEAAPISSSQRTRRGCPTARKTFSRTTAPGSCTRTSRGTRGRESAAFTTQTAPYAGSPRTCMGGVGLAVTP